MSHVNEPPPWPSQAKAHYQIALTTRLMDNRRMGLKVLIAPDKFKGTLSARAAAEAMARGWRQNRPDDSIELLPISDGGEGFGELVSACLGAEARTCHTMDAAHRPCEAEWWWEPRSRTAIVEAARVNGLSQLPPGRYHPFEMDTSGLGAVFAAAAGLGARRCLIGIGGSATNDGGFGLARALGWVFQNDRGQVIERWTELHALSQVHARLDPVHFDEVLVAVDVQNPLLGLEGCTRVYGPQKGLSETDFPFAERCLGRLAEVVCQKLRFDAGAVAGAGAAGGLGFGLLSFMGARLEPGFALFARHAGLPARVSEAQLVLTGEGAIDASTLMGKGVGELASLCQASKVPCLGLAGAVLCATAGLARFDRVYGVVPELASRELALAAPAVSLERLAARAAGEWRTADSEWQRPTTQIIVS
jgi:glycerate 2-kinase